MPITSPTIPASEYPIRWQAVQAFMAQQGLDVLIAYADDRAVFGPAHARWLVNLPVHFEPVMVLVPRSGPPVLLCGPESVEYALRASQATDVRALREFTHPDEDYPFSTIQGLAEVLAGIGYDAQAIRRAGLAGRGLMNADLMAALERALPQAKWIDVENAVCDLRAQKSPAELAVIRHAYRIAEIGLQAGIDAIRPGVTERAVAAEIDAAMRRAGSEGAGIDTIVASGMNTRPILARSTFREIDRDDLVLLTVAPRYEGYHAAIGRPVLVGDPGELIAQVVEQAWEAQEACFRLMRPGVEGRVVEAAGRRVMEAAGLGPNFLYSGLHSVGVIEFEPPIFGPSSPATLKPGMVVSVDIPVFNTVWGGLRMEDGFVITDTGAERLNRTPYRLH